MRGCWRTAGGTVSATAGSAGATAGGTSPAAVRTGAAGGSTGGTTGGAGGSDPLGTGGITGCCRTADKAREAQVQGEEALGATPAVAGTALVQI